MKRHELDVLSLVCGLLVVAASLAALLRPWHLTTGEWLLPAALVLTGFTVLVVTLTTSRRDPATVAAPVTTGEDPTTDPSPVVDGTATTPIELDALRDAEIEQADDTSSGPAV